jgi:4-carboxymuconolactone decarboxylase
LGQITPSLVQYTTDVLFRDLWLRPGLAPRDRSLVTVSALVATGQVAQITNHLNRAMDNGLTREEVGRCSVIWRSTPVGRARSLRHRSSRR